MMQDHYVDHIKQLQDIKQAKTEIRLINQKQNDSMNQ